jgi:hypothetical protein
MGLGSGATVQKWYAVRNGRKTGIFGTWEQVQEQISGFEGASVREFERLENGGVDRGLLQAKMWLRSGSHTEMLPPASRPPAAWQQGAAAQRPPEEPPGPSARRFSPMLLNAFHWGFFGEVCGREAEAGVRCSGGRADARGRPGMMGAAVAASDRRDTEQFATPGEVGASNKGSDAVATIRRALKRPRPDEPPVGDLYARQYQERRGNRSVLS